MLKNLNTKGFAAVEAVLLVVILAIIGGTGYYVWQSNKKTDDTFNQASKAAQSSPAKVTAPVDSTTSWLSYTSAAGKFSLKYPKTWVQASNPGACTPGIALFGPDQQSVGKCGSEDFGQVSIVSTNGDSRTDEDISQDPGFKSVQTKSVTVDSVEGQRVQATAGSDPGGEGDFSIQAGPSAYPVGATVVKYIFYTSGNTYVATYVQPAGSKNVLAQFDAIITKTLKFE